MPKSILALSLLASLATAPTAWAASHQNPGWAGMPTMQPQRVDWDDRREHARHEWRERAWREHQREEAREHWRWEHQAPAWYGGYYYRPW